EHNNLSKSQEHRTRMHGRAVDEINDQPRMHGRAVDEINDQPPSPLILARYDTQMAVIKKLPPQD
ncbi:MAG: hypothetical protein PHG58_09620, partial [Clostridia bacterium]|nr:hypothetical protein [Clostridia bacterium]